MTDLARRVAPPDKVSFARNSGGGANVLAGVVAAVAGLGGYVIGGLFWAIAAFVVVLVVAAAATGAASGPEWEAQYRAALRRWDKSYLCLRCGEAVLADDSGSLQVRDQGDPEVDLLLRQGKRIHAVKAVVDKTGLGIADAAKQVDARARELNL